MNVLAQDVSRDAGQVLTIGFEGRQCDAAVAGLLAEIRPGGVIFFQRNIATEEQFQSLVSDVRRALGSPEPILAVDLEGGLVDRFRDLIAPLPPFRDAARAGLSRLLGRLAGRELAAFSLNVDFAPVLDLGAAESEDVLASRTAGERPERVVEHAAEFLSGLEECGVLGCGKHFPGLGHARQDSHHSMPAIDRPEEALWTEDMLPFRALAARLPMVMVAHAWYPALAESPGQGMPEGAAPLPASLSHRVVSGFLRQRIGYQGLIVCDDLEMGGALEGRTIEQAAVAAVRAGCDVLLVCRHARNVHGVFAALVREGERDASFRALLAQAAGRIRAVSGRLKAALPAPQPSRCHQLREEITQFAEQVRVGLAGQPLGIG